MKPRPRTWQNAGGEKNESFQNNEIQRGKGSRGQPQISKKRVPKQKKIQWSRPRLHPSPERQTSHEAKCPFDRAIQRNEKNPAKITGEWKGREKERREKKKKKNRGNQVESPSRDPRLANPVSKGSPKKGKGD